MSNYFEGKNYRALLEERQGRSFSEAEVIEILQQVLPPLAHLHAQGKINGDISLDSLVQNPNTLQAALVPAGGRIVPKGQRETGQRSAVGDVSGLGRTVIALLIGKSPDQLGSDGGTENWQDDCVVSDQLAAILETAIAVEPSFRYSDASQMLQSVNSAFAVPAVGSWPQAGLGGSGMMRVTAPTVEQPPGLAPWHWALIGSVMTALLGLAAYGLLAFLNKPPDTTTATLQGYLANNQMNRYLLRCSGGQLMGVQVRRGDVSIRIFSPSGRLIGTALKETEQWQGRLPSNGDYVVEVSALSPADYRVYVEVLW